MEKARCKVSVTTIIYAPIDVSMPGLVRRAMELGGRVNSVNEELRRVVFSSPLPEARRIAEEAVSRGVPGENIAFEVTVACRGLGAWRVPKSFVSKRVGRRLIAAGICEGRVVVVEVKTDIVLIKIGRLSRNILVRAFPPPGEVVLARLPESDDIQEVVKCVLKG